MAPTRTMEKWRRQALALLAALSCLALSALHPSPAHPAADGDANPHAALADPAKCDGCHTGEVSFAGEPKRPMAFIKDTVSLCLDCHGGQTLSNIHPVEIRPGMKVPTKLALDGAGAITCATCHDPHMPFESDEPYVSETLTDRLRSVFTGRKRHRTFFLRMPNDKGQLCAACHGEGKRGAAPSPKGRDMGVDDYAGSARCGQCHESHYRQWKDTGHARMTRSAAEQPDAVLGDFENDPPFDRSTIVFALGTRWAQRYVVEQEGHLVVKAPVWSITGKRWELSCAPERTWDQYCQGCHTTGFEMVEEPRYAELGIGCEACHGPGGAHAGSDGRDAIVNPRKLTEERREMICQACHTSGHDITGQFKFPLGYKPGDDLTLYYKGLMPMPGQDSDTFKGDGSYGDRRRQWRFWIDSYMNARGATCDHCIITGRHAPQVPPSAKMTVNAHCVTCHVGLHVEPELHATHRKAEVQCTGCHTPVSSEGAASYSIHDHKFLFAKPAAEAPETPRETCAGCH